MAEIFAGIVHFYKYPFMARYTLRFSNWQTDELITVLDRNSENTVAAGLFPRAFRDRFTRDTREKFGGPSRGKKHPPHPRAAYVQLHAV